MRTTIVVIVAFINLLFASVLSSAETLECNQKYAAQAEALLREAGLAHGVGAYRQVVGLASRAIVLCPTNVKAYLTRAMANSKVGHIADWCLDFDKVNDLISQGASIPEHMVSVMQKARKYCSKEGYGPFWDLYWNETNPKRAKAHFDRGTEYLAAGDLEGAKAELTKAKTLAPGRAAVEVGLEIIADVENSKVTREAARHIAIAATFWGYGDVDTAIDEISRAIELAPKYAPAYNGRAVYKREKGDNTGALKDYSKAIELDPFYARAYYNRTFIYHALEDHDQVIQDLKRASELNPKYEKIYKEYLRRYGK